MVATVVLFILLNIGDGYSTYIGLKDYSLKEANPLIRKLIEKMGLLNALIFAKIPTVAIGLYFLVSSSLWWPLAIVDVIYLVVVGNNFRLILSRKNERK